MFAMAPLKLHVSPKLYHYGILDVFPTCICTNAIS